MSSTDECALRCFTNAPKSEISFTDCEVWYFNPYVGCMWKGGLLRQVHQVPHWTWKFTVLCGFSCDFANWYFWTPCHTEYNASKSLFLLSFWFKKSFYIPMISAIHSNSIFMQQLSVFATYFCKTTWIITWKKLSQMWDLMDFSQQPTLSQTASIWVKISYLTIRKADFWFGGLLKHLRVHRQNIL